MIVISVIISVTLPPDLVETHQKKVTPKRPPVSFNPSLIDIFCRKRGERPFIISACLLTIVSGAITSQVLQKMRHNILSTQIVATFRRKLFHFVTLWASPAMLDCSTRKFSSRNTIKSVAFIYFFYWINIYFVLNQLFLFLWLVLFLS